MAEAGNPTISYSRIFRVFWQSWVEILWCAAILLAVATAAAAVSQKEYLARATVRQSDLTPALQDVDGLGGALGMLANGGSLNARINAYVSLIASPEMGTALMEHDEFIDILFDDKWQRSGKDWVHKPSLTWEARSAVCMVFQIECAQALSPLQVSDELAKRLTIEPSATVVQGVLTNIGNTDTYDLRLRGKNPPQLLAMLQFLHRAANERLQADRVATSQRMVDSIADDVEATRNEASQQQLIGILTTEQKKLAILRSGYIGYAADWLVQPTLAPWPVRPNILLYYTLALIAAVGCGPAVQWARSRRRRRKGAIVAA